VLSVLEPSISQTWLSRNAQRPAASQQDWAVFATRNRHDGGISVPYEIGQTASPIVFQSHPVRC
jgi:hypothetical protein